MTLIAKVPPTANGTTEKTSAKNLTVAQVLPQPKKEEKTPQPQNDLKPLEDRMLRINQLWTLQGKHQRLIESQLRLKKFLAEVDKENLKLSIKSDDYRAEEFTTKNSVVIADVIDFLINATNEKIKQLEPLLNW
jgi:hypothetical protein